METNSDLIKHAQEFSKCAKDVFYFATQHVRTLDQVEEGEKRKLFPKWDYLEMLLNRIRAPGDFFVDKSRDMCASWTIMVHFLHSMIFEEGWAGFAISRKQAEVDDGGEFSTPESLYGRIRYMHTHLPFWLKPKFRFTTLKIQNLEPGMESYATGESANPNSGRNVACTFKFADEFAFLPRNDQESINRAMRYGAYRTLLYMTTAQQGTYAERISKDPEGLGFEKIELPWKLRPDRTEEWYQAQVAKSDEADILAELDISYSVAEKTKILSPYFDIGEDIIDPSEAPPMEAFEEIAIGLDYGWLITAAEFCGKRRGIWYVFAELYEREKTTEEIAEILSLTCRELNFDAPIYTGKDRPDIIEQLHRRGFFVRGMMELVSLRIGALVVAFRKKHVKIVSNAAGLLAEIPRYKRKKVEGIIVDSPAKHQDDHAVDALGYVLLGTGDYDEQTWLSEWGEAKIVKPSDWTSEWKSEEKARWVHDMEMKL